SLAGADGVVSKRSRSLLIDIREAQLVCLKLLTTPSARLRTLRGFLLIAQPPLLENGGEWGSALLHIDSLGKRGAGPTRRHRGNPLIVPVWETAFEVDLKLRRPAGHVPRPVGALRRQQKFDAFPVHVLAGLNHTGVGQHP